MSEDQNKSENEIPSDGRFLTENLSVFQMPSQFYLGNEVKYGFLAMKKWSRAQESSGIPDLEGTEVSAVLFVDTLNRIKLKDLSVGSIISVETDIEDLTKSSKDEITKRLHRVPIKGKGEKKFILVPDDYSNSYPKISNVIVEKGKMLVGTIHVHATGNPPSDGDFTNFLLGGDGVIDVVVSGDEIFALVRGKETYNLPVEQYAKYRESLRGEEDKLIKDGTGSRGSDVNRLIGMCLEKRVALYRASLEDGVFQRLI